MTNSLRALGGELQTLAEQLIGHELVPGYRPAAPTFVPTSAAQVRRIARETPLVFREFIQEVGLIQAMDTATGLVFLSPEQGLAEREQQYGARTLAVDGKSTFPFAASSDGSLYLLASDDSGVWHLAVYAPTPTEPTLVAPGFEGFLRFLYEDWTSFLQGSSVSAVLK